MMQFVDTHCHIHESPVLDAGDDATRQKWAKIGHPDPDDIIADAVKHGVTRMICVGCTLEDSRRAVALVAKRAHVWASIGVHPHEAVDYVQDPEALETFETLVNKPKVVAIGECGLDYHYHNSPKEAQQQILRFQLALAQKHKLPMIFHVRDAFDDFWSIFDEYKDIRGVIHSFSATEKELNQILRRNLYVGLNGIMTFTKDDAQLSAARKVPLSKLLLETDAPFLTPAPHRGTICLPKHVRVTAEFLAELRGEPLTIIAKASTQNAQMLFDF